MLMNLEFSEDAPRKLGLRWDSSLSENKRPLVYVGDSDRTKRRKESDIRIYANKERQPTHPNIREHQRTERDM